MDIKKVKQLAKIMEENDLRELSLHEKDDFITLKRGVEEINAVMPSLIPNSAGGHNVVQSHSSVTEESVGKSQDQSEGTIIRSPMVGTFYASPSPDSPPFVSVGDRVSVQSHLCIIEAMKVMNHIKSEYSGVIKEVLVQDGVAIEYDTPLFVIKED